LLRGHAQIRDEAGFLVAVLERQSINPPVLGSGVALPHARTPLVGEIVCVAARCREPVAFGPDAVPVRLIFLFGIPPHRITDSLTVNLVAIILLFELTLNYQVVMPIMLAGVISYYVCRSLTSHSFSGEALLRKGQVAVSEYLAKLKVGDLMTQDHEPVAAAATFGEVVGSFLHGRSEYLHVVEDGRFVGTISLHDIKPYLDQPDLEGLLIAKDVMREDVRALEFGQSMDSALLAFGQADSECLPVVDRARKFLGSVTRADLLLFPAGTSRHSGE
jgi:CBS domain-containing protein